jgi:hypothetical protein
MKKLFGLSGIRWLFVFSVFLLFGCGGTKAVFIEDHGQEYTARNIDELKEYMKSPESYAYKVKWKDITYPMADGYYGFVEPIGKNCDIHWMVNKRHKLVRYDAKGEGCDTTKSSDMELMNIKSVGKDQDGKIQW